MKILKSIIYIIVISIVTVSCSNDNNTNNDIDFLPPIKVEIPAELKDNAEVVNMITSSEKAINEFSINIETLIVENKDIWNKTDDELSIMDRVKLGTTLAQFVTNSTEIASIMDKFSNMKDDEIFKDLNDQQFKALDEIGKTLERRIDEINKKYEDLEVK